MRTLTLLAALLAALLAPLTPAFAQDDPAPDGVLIDGVELSGLSMSQLSPGLRQTIEQLKDTPLSKDHLADLAARIEAERPEVVVAVRTISRPEAKAHVIFLVAKVSDDVHLQTNINTRYIVEDVSIEGVSDRLITKALRDDLQTLVGQPLNSEDADKLLARLKTELPGRRVHRRVTRGSQRGLVHVVFDVTTPPWIPFAPSRSRFLFHGDQDWTGAIDIVAGSNTTHGSFEIIFEDKDELIEKYRGYRFGFMSRKLGTQRVGARVDISWLRESWEQVTLTTLDTAPAIPGAYQTRLNIEPAVSFAFNPHVRVWAGISSSELQPLADLAPAVHANVFLASIGYDQTWRADSGRHRIEASYLVRSSSDALDSDLEYTRHLGEVKYEFRHGRNTLLANLTLGHISGEAPLFERFSLGNTTTLRGWNKYELAPIGGANVYSQTFEYRLRALALFLDTGSVWQHNTDSKLRLSAGFGFHAENVFATFGFPLNGNDASGTFMMGVRF